MAFTKFESRSFTVGIFVLYAIVALYFDYYISLLYGLFSVSALVYYLTSHLHISKALHNYNEMIVRFGLAGIISTLIIGITLFISAIIFNAYFVLFIWKRIINSLILEISYLLLVLMTLIGIIWTLFLYYKLKKSKG